MSKTKPPIQKLPEEDKTKPVFSRIFVIEDISYGYEFNQLSVRQAYDAETYFKMYDKLFEALPNDPKDEQKAVVFAAKSKAVGTLLMKIDMDKANKMYYEYDAATHQPLNLMNKIKCIERKKLEECKADFFTNMGLVSNESMKESLKETSELLCSIKELPENLQREILQTAMLVNPKT